MADSYLNINLELPENFVEDLYQVIHDEIELAQKKWKVKLSEEQKNSVFENSRTQTRLKTSTIAKQPWDLGRKLALKIPYPQSAQNVQLNVKPDSKVTRKISLMLTKDGWVIANEESESPVNVADILDKQLAVITQWARTAAFYGVGSFAR